MKIKRAAQVRKEMMDDAAKDGASLTSYQNELLAGCEKAEVLIDKFLKLLEPKTPDDFSDEIEVSADLDYRSTVARLHVRFRNPYTDDDKKEYVRDFYGKDGRVEMDYNRNELANAVAVLDECEKRIADAKEAKGNFVALADGFKRAGLEVSQARLEGHGITVKLDHPNRSLTFRSTDRNTKVYLDGMYEYNFKVEDAAKLARFFEQNAT